MDDKKVYIVLGIGLALLMALSVYLIIHHSILYRLFDFM